MNPFDVDDAELERRVIRNPFAFGADSPITAAVNTEALRQANLLFRSALSDVSLSRTQSVCSRPGTCGANYAKSLGFNEADTDALVAALVGDIWSDEPTMPAIMVTDDSSTNKSGSKIARSRTDAKLSAGDGGNRQIIRAASARAVISRRMSSRAISNAAGTASSTTTSIPAGLAAGLSPTALLSDITNRPASSRAISSRAGAIAAGDAETIELVRSRSQQFGSRPTSSAIHSSRPVSSAAVTENTDDAERCDLIFELIIQKFRKHIRCEECTGDHFCMCSRGCEETATVFAQRYGRLGNIARVRPGYYCMGHLVDVFIDAYDEEKRMADIEKASYR